MRPSRSIALQRTGFAALTACILLGEASCASTAADRGYWMSREAAPAPEGARLALAPINFRDALPYPLAPRLALVERELEGYLNDHGIEPLRVQKRSFDAMWNEASSEVGTLYGIPEELLRERYDAAMAITIGALRLRSKQPFDALVVPTVVYRNATVSGLDASWDRVVRSLPTANTPGLTLDSDVASPRSIPALSLRVEVFDPEGERIFEGYGGLEIPERLDLATNLSQPRGDALIDTHHIREALELALSPYLPPR